MNTTASLKPVLLTTAAALLCTGLQFSGIDALAAPRSARIEAQIVQLPAVSVVARRLDRATGTAQALGAAPGPAT